MHPIAGRKAALARMGLEHLFSESKSGGEPDSADQKGLSLKTFGRMQPYDLVPGR
jgi:hypothetical protein